MNAHGFRHCVTWHSAVSALPMSVPSKSLLGTADDSFSDTRSCLQADNMQRIVFLKANSSFTNWT